MCHVTIAQPSGGAVSRDTSGGGVNVRSSRKQSQMKCQGVLGSGAKKRCPPPKKRKFTAPPHSVVQICLLVRESQTLTWADLRQFSSSPAPILVPLEMFLKTPPSGHVIGRAARTPTAFLRDGVP